MKHIHVQRTTSVRLLMGLLKLATMPWRDSPLRKHLQRRRKMFGIAMRDVVHECGWNTLYVVQWEAGSRTPTPAQLDAWIGALDKLTAELTAPCNRALTHRAEAA